MKYLLFCIFIVLVFTTIVKHISNGGESTQVPEVYQFDPINISDSICIKNPRISMFMYHYIRDPDKHDTPTTARLSVSTQLFARHMLQVSVLREQKKIITMNGDAFLKAFETGCFPGDSIWIFTDDDGWSDSYNSLYPIAKQYNIPFFFGIITGKLDTPGFVTSNQVLEISKDPLFNISSHSMTHRDQSILTEKDDYNEICESKKILETITKKNIKTYIYPSGKFNKKSSMIHLQKCGYIIAWSTHYGEDWNEKKLPYVINRIRITSDTSPEFFKQLSEQDMEKISQ